MTTITVDNPFPYFTNNYGDALENGSIYIGVAGTDAETNPIAVYWDDAKTVPAVQPIRTIGGYPDNDGSASNFFTGSDFSITIRDSAGVLVASKLQMNANELAIYELAATGVYTIYDTIQDLEDSTEEARGEGVIWQAGGRRYQEADNSVVDAHLVTAGGVKLYDLTPMSVAPDLRQRKSFEPFAGFDNGTTDTQIFPGSRLPPQGVAWAEVAGVQKVFVSLQDDSGGSTPERYRITEYNMGSAAHVAFSGILNIAHSQDLSASVDGGNVTLYAQAEGSEPDVGKGLSVIDWQGAATTQANVTAYQLFGDTGSGHRYERYRSATTGVYGDKVVLLANDTKEEVDDTGHYLFVYSLAEIIAAPDPLDVEPKVGPVPVLIGPESGQGTLQGCAPSQDYIAVLRGFVNPFQRKLVQFIDYEGNLIRGVEYAGSLNDYTQAQLGNDATLGTLITQEPEGITCDNLGRVMVICQEEWRADGDVVSWEGLSMTPRRSSVTEEPGSSDDWVPTSLAPSGAWTPGTYAWGANYTRRAKVIHIIDKPLASGADDPMGNAKQFVAPVATIKPGDNAVDVSIPYPRDYLVGTDLGAPGKIRRLEGYYNQHSHRFFDAREGADNEAYSTVAVDFTDGRQIMELRGASSLALGAGLNVYGKDDPDFPGQFRAWGTDTAGTSIEAINYNPNADRWDRLRKIPQFVAATGERSAHTGDTNETTLAEVEIPGGLMGVNGLLRIRTQTGQTNNANDKTFKIKLNGVEIVNTTVGVTSSAGTSRVTQVQNRNSTSSQVVQGATSSLDPGETTVAPTTLAVDTSANMTLTITGQLTDAADEIALESYSVEAVFNPGSVGAPLPPPVPPAADVEYDITYASRADFEAATVPSNVDKWSIFSPPIPSADTQVVSYVKADPSIVNVAIESANGVKGVPAQDTTPDHFADNTGATMLSAFQSAVDYEIERVGAGLGYFTKPSPVVQCRGNASYYLDGTVSAESDGRSLKLFGNGCRVTTDYDGPLFSFGDADVFTADAAGTVPTYGIHVRDFKFTNTNLTAASSIAIRLGRCWNAVIADNVFYDFWIDVDNHGTGHSWIERNQGFLRDRTASKQAFARFQGVYASDNNKIDGTGIHFNRNEISGLPADSTAQANFIEIKSVDGFYFAQNHAQHIDCFLRVEPAGSADNYKNNRTFDIISNGGNYADNPGGNQVRIIGTVAYTGGGGRQNGLYKNIKLDRSDWIRGAGVAQSGVTVNVTDGGGYAAQFGGLTGIELRGHFDQHADTPISVLGANSGRLECIGLEIEARFSSARSGGGGGAGCAFVEANSVFIHDCIVNAEDNAPDYAFTLNLTSTGADAAVTITGNDYSKSTYAIAPHNISAPLETSVSVYGNISKAGAGRIIKEEFRILADQGEVAIPWTYTFPGNKTGIDVKIRALGQTHPSQGLQDRTTGSEAAGTFYRNAAAATFNIGGFGSQIYLNTNIGTNDAPVWPVLMTGAAWPTTTSVNAGDVYVAGGNVYLVVVGGTTGASQPTHTNGFASTGTETSAYVGAESVNTISAVLGGNTSTRMYWTGEVELLQAR